EGRQARRQRYQVDAPEPWHTVARVVVEMALLWHDRARLGATQPTQRQVVGQGARGHEDSRLFAEHRGAALLEPFDRPTACKAVRRHAYFVLKGLQPAYQPMGALGFAIASQ